MKYVIKGIGVGYQYVQYVENTVWFQFTKKLNEARQFDSIQEIINVFVDRAKIRPSYTADYTIVGVQEISTPTYREVLL